MLVSAVPRFPPELGSQEGCVALPPVVGRGNYMAMLGGSGPGKPETLVILPHRSTAGAGWCSGNPPARGPSGWRSIRMRSQCASEAAPRLGGLGPSSPNLTQ